MKPNPFPRPRPETHAAFAPPRDDHRYRAEHPSRPRRATRFSLQRWIIYTLVALMLLGLFASV